jgi:hypothetical protein
MSIRQKVDQSLYQPRAWEVLELRPGRYRAECAGERLWISAYASGEYRVYNERTDATYDVDAMLGCSCPSWERRRAAGENCCKHTAAIISREARVALGDRDEQTARTEKARLDVAGLGL